MVQGRFTLTIDGAQVPSNALIKDLASETTVAYAEHAETVFPDFVYDLLPNREGGGSYAERTAGYQNNMRTQNRWSQQPTPNDQPTENPEQRYRKEIIEAMPDEMVAQFRTKLETNYSVSVLPASVALACQKPHQLAAVVLVTKAEVVSFLAKFGKTPQPFMLVTSERIPKLPSIFVTLISKCGRSRKCNGSTLLLVDITHLLG